MAQVRNLTSIPFDYAAGFRALSVGYSPARSQPGGSEPSLTYGGVTATSY